MTEEDLFGQGGLKTTWFCKNITQTKRSQKYNNAILLSSHLCCLIINLAMHWADANEQCLFLCCHFGLTLEWVVLKSCSAFQETIFHYLQNKWMCWSQSTVTKHSLIQILALVQKGRKENLLQSLKNNSVWSKIHYLQFLYNSKEISKQFLFDDSQNIVLWTALNQYIAGNAHLHTL